MEYTYTKQEYEDDIKRLAETIWVRSAVMALETTPDDDREFHDFLSLNATDEVGSFIEMDLDSIMAVQIFDHSPNAHGRSVDWTKISHYFTWLDEVVMQMARDVVWLDVQAELFRRANANGILLSALDHVVK